MSEMGESASLATDLVMEGTEADHGHGMRQRWHTLVALTTLVLAMMAAVGALFAGLAGEEATATRTQEAITVSLEQGESLEIQVLMAKHDILVSLGETPDADEVAKVLAYETDVAALEDEIELERQEIGAFRSAHVMLAVAVTVLSVGITICGVAIVVDKKALWLAGSVMGGLGAVFLILGLWAYFT